MNFVILLLAAVFGFGSPMASAGGLVDFGIKFERERDHKLLEIGPAETLPCFSVGEQVHSFFHLNIKGSLVTLTSELKDGSDSDSDTFFTIIPESLTERYKAMAGLPLEGVVEILAPGQSIEKTSFRYSVKIVDLVALSIVNPTEEEISKMGEGTLVSLRGKVIAIKEGKGSDTPGEVQILLPDRRELQVVMMSGPPTIEDSFDEKIELEVHSPVQVEDNVLVRALFRGRRINAQWRKSFYLVQAGPSRQKKYDEIHGQNAVHLKAMSERIADADFRGARKDSAFVMKNFCSSSEAVQIGMLIERMPKEERPLFLRLNRYYVDMLAGAFELDFDSMKESDLLKFADDWAALKVHPHEAPPHNLVDETYVYDVLRAANIDSEVITCIQMQAVLDRLQLFERMLGIGSPMKWSDQYVMNQTMESISQAAPTAEIVKFELELQSELLLIPASVYKANVFEGAFGLDSHLNTALARARVAARTNPAVAAALHPDTVPSKK